MTESFRDPIHPGFPRTVLILWIKTAVYQCSSKFSSKSQTSRGFSWSLKHWQNARIFWLSHGGRKYL